MGEVQGKEGKIVDGIVERPASKKWCGAFSFWWPPMICSRRQC